MDIKLLKQFLVILFAVSILASYTKDEPVILENAEIKQDERINDESTMQNLLKSDFEVKEKNAAEATIKRCFELNFPLNIVYPDKTTSNVNSFEALETAFGTWYEQNRGTTEEPMLNFPVEVTLMDGTIEAINDESELLNLMRECFENENVVKRKCFEINFPVEIVLEGQNEATAINNEADFENLFKSRDEKIKYEFVFPISITLKKGAIKTLESNEDFKAIKAYCNEKGKEKDDDDKDDKDWEDVHNNFEFDFLRNQCFQIEFPVSFTLQNGNTITADSYEAIFKTIAEQLRDNNGEFKELAIAYPLTVTINADRTTVTLNSEEELKGLYKECEISWEDDKDNDNRDEDWENDFYDDIDWNFFKNSCFTVDLPFDLTIDGVEKIAISNYETMFETISTLLKSNDYELEDVALNYPVSVTLIDGTAAIISTEEDFEELEKTCEDKFLVDWDNEEEWEDYDWVNENEFESEVFELLKNRCFEMQLPISITTKAGEVVEFKSYEEIMETLTELFRNNEIVDFEEITLNYPVTVILKDGATEAITSEEELEKVIEACEDNRGHGWGNDDDDDRDEDWGFGDFDFGDFDLDGIMFEDFDLSQFDFSDFQNLGDFKIFCFEINFPIVVNVSDEERISAENFGDLIQQMFEVILTNRDKEIEPKVDYPITVTMEDGTIKTINTNDEFEELAKNCKD